MAFCGQLYIVSVQKLYGDLAEFLAHEIQSFTHPLSNFDTFNLPSTKSDLLGCIELPGQPEPPLTHDNKVMDGAVIVHCLSASVSTSQSYAIFIPYLENHLHTGREARVFAGKCLATPNCQTIGWTFFVTKRTRRNFVILIPKVA